MSSEQVIDDDSLYGIDRFVGDPVATHIMGPEGLDWQPVGVEKAGLHPSKPVSLDDMDTARIALAEESLPVLGRGR
jgi:hypothetical protein